MHATTEAQLSGPRLGDPVPEDAHLLAEISYGAACLPAAPGRLAFGVPLAVLGGDPGPERWWTSGPARCGRRGAVRWAKTEHSLFGVATVACGRGSDLEAATLKLYRELFEAIGAAGFPWPLRIWNVLPAINRDDFGLERYQRFCRGRSLAFEQAYGDSFPNRLCAASAVGSAEDAPDLLHVTFLAGREPGISWENPRQVPAWRYPSQYGPRSPSFTRATTLPASLGGLIIVSGTASIVGHESRHEGDLDAQLDETVINLAAMVNHASGRALDAPDWRSQLQSLKVYLRNRRDLERVRARLLARLGAVPALYLEADICRHELLLEIEAVATGG